MTKLEVSTKQIQASIKHVLRAKFGFVVLNSPFSRQTCFYRKHPLQAATITYSDHSLIMKSIQSSINQWSDLLKFGLEQCLPSFLALNSLNQQFFDVLKLIDISILGGAVWSHNNMTFQSFGTQGEQTTKTEACKFKDNMRQEGCSHNKLSEHW